MAFFSSTDFNTNCLVKFFYYSIVQLVTRVVECFQLYRFGLNLFSLSKICLHVKETNLNVYEQGI